MENHELYNWLSENYDNLIQWDDRLKRELPLLFKLLPRPEDGPIVDFGCGTGGHLKSLAEKGYQCFGMDLSQSLIQLAKQKLPQFSDNIIVGNILEEVPKHWPLFSALLCLGNTLSHFNEKQLRQFLVNAFQCSKTGGQLIVENRNWNRILYLRERFLKPVQTNQGLFIRLLDYPPKLNGSPITMTVALWKNETWSSSSVLLYPHLHHQLFTIFQDVGWKFITEFGNFLGSPFEEFHSTDWVSVWEKK
ncbi:MAG: class I SAM-dependent methyltransferase [bacterium]|nr:class I SAM-dependent methyltransferase [bacterium]